MGDTTAAGGRDDAIRRLFACFPEGHPLWPDVERFRRWVEAHDRYHELKQDDAGAAFSEIKRRIRARVKDGQWKLKALEVWMACAASNRGRAAGDMVQLLSGDRRIQHL